MNGMELGGGMKIKRKVFLGIIMGAIIIANSFVVLTFIMHPSSDLMRPLRDLLHSISPFRPPRPTLQNETVERLNNRYNATIVTRIWVSERPKEIMEEMLIKYTDESGNHSATFWGEMRNSFDWIKTNTSENSVFLCDWFYGHMIKGYAERDVVARNPSKELILIPGYAADPRLVKELDPHERIVDIATAFTTIDLNVTAQIMEKYEAFYLLVDRKETNLRTQFYWFFKIINKEIRDFLECDKDGWPIFPLKFTEMGRKTALYRFATNENATGFTLVYSDDWVNIYKLNRGDKERG